MGRETEQGPQGPYFVLASGSPRRRELLGVLGRSFVVVRPEQGGREIDERPGPGEEPAALVQRLSRLKAEAVAGMDMAELPFESPPDRVRAGRVVVIGADTVVVLGGRILGKPASPAEAVAMLRALRAGPHLVYSGVTAALRGGPAATRLHRSRVWMRPYSDEDIAAYVTSGDPLDKAGAYAIQHPIFAPVARLEGCFASVMGLPLGELAGALAEIGVEAPAVGPGCRARTGQRCCQEGLPAAIG